MKREGSIQCRSSSAASPGPERAARLVSTERCMVQILRDARTERQPTTDLTVSERSLRLPQNVPRDRRERRMARTLEANPARTGTGGSDRRKWWVLAAMVFGLFMPMLD